MRVTLGALILLVAASQSWGQTLGGNNNWTGINTFPKINNVIYVDGTKYPLTAAGINAALTACTTGSSHQLFLPPMSIIATAQIAWSGNTCDLEGAGRGVTVITAGPGMANITLIVPSGASRIEHMTLIGAGAGSADAISNGPVQNVTINDVDISNFGAEQINSGNGSTNWTITNNYIHDGMNEGILYGMATGGIISGNFIYRNANNGIDLGGSSYVTVTGNRLESDGGSSAPAIDQDCIVIFSGSTASNAAHNNTITSNQMDHCNTHGIRLQAGSGGFVTDNTITGNTIYEVGVGNGSTVGGAGIILRNDTTNGQVLRNSITGNTVYSSNGTGSGTCNGDGGCELSSDGAGAFSSNTWSGNTLTGNGNYGLELINSNVLDTVVGSNNLVRNTTGPSTDSSSRSMWGCNHTQTNMGGCEISGTLLSTSYSRASEQIADQGSACTNPEIALGAGWQSTGTASVSNAAGTGQTCSWTITTGATTSANPTITDTLTNALPTANTVCWVTLHNGTAATPIYADQTTRSATAPAFTVTGTPSASGATYKLIRVCGP